LTEGQQSQLVSSHSQYEQWLSTHRPKFIVCVSMCVCVCSGVKRLFSVGQERGQLGWTLRAGPLSQQSIIHYIPTTFHRWPSIPLTQTHTF